MEQQIVISCMGRPLGLGMLYDCRSEQIVPGVTLWNQEKLRSKSDIRQGESSRYDVTADDSIQNKAHSLDIEASLKLSFLCGLVSVTGSAKYLKSNRSSASQARVVLTYNCKTFFEQLTMDQLAMKNIDYPEAFDKNMATHVVTGVEYGVDAVFVFDRQASSYEDRSHLEGALKASISKIPTLSVEADAKVKFEDEDNMNSSQFKCTFYGDIVLRDSPTTFKEAMDVYKLLPSLIRETKSHGNIYGVPKKVYLYPLCKLDNQAAKLVRMISANVVAEVQSLMEEFNEIVAEANDLERSSTAQHFHGMRQQIRKLKSLLDQFQSEFQQMLAEILPQIRGGGAEESLLLGKLRTIKRSPYDVEKLRSWMNVKTREFACLESYINTLKESGAGEESDDSKKATLVHLAFQPGQLEKFTQNGKLKYVLCLSLGGITSMEDKFIQALEQFSINSPDVSSMANWDQAEDSWCDEEDITAHIQEQIRLLCDIARINVKEASNLACVATAPAGRKTTIEEAGAMWLYVKGRKQKFQPPSAPGKPTAKEIGQNHITITWSPPASGVESALHYKILYRGIGSSNKISVITVGLETEFCFQDLREGTGYLFEVVAVTQIGYGQPSDESDLRTKRSPAKEAIISDCKLLMQGENGQPSWYQPNVKETTRQEGHFCLKAIEIGQPCSAERKKILLLGPNPSGRTSLINGMVNYLFGVELEDNFRLQLVAAPSEYPEHIMTSPTWYVIQPGTGSQFGNFPYTLEILDIDDMAYNTNPCFEDYPQESLSQANTASYIEQRRFLRDYKFKEHNFDFVWFVFDSANPMLTGLQDGLSRVLESKEEDLHKIALVFTIMEDKILQMNKERETKRPETVQEFIYSLFDDNPFPAGEAFHVRSTLFTPSVDDTQQTTLKSQNQSLKFWDYAMFQTFFSKLTRGRPSTT